MDRQEVTRRGFKIGEVDQYKNGIYASTTEFYDLKGDIYAIFTSDNSMTYNGRPFMWFYATKQEWADLNSLAISMDTGLSTDDINKYLARPYGDTLIERGYLIGKIEDRGFTIYYDINGDIYINHEPDNRRYYNGEPYSYKCDTKSDWEQLTTAEIINNTGLSENDINSYLWREAAAK